MDRHVLFGALLGLALWLASGLVNWLMDSGEDKQLELFVEGRLDRSARGHAIKLFLLHAGLNIPALLKLLSRKLPAPSAEPPLKLVP